MYLQVKILTLNIFTHMLYDRPVLPIPPSTLQLQLSPRFYHQLSGEDDMRYWVIFILYDL